MVINLCKCVDSNYFVKQYMPELFRFPIYYGKNLDALNDCMRDLVWIPEKTIRIKFTNLKKASVDDTHGVQEVLSMFRAWKEDHSRRNAKNIFLET